MAQCELATVAVLLLGGSAAMLVAVLVARRWARSRLRQLLHPAHHRRGSNVDEDAVPWLNARSSQRVLILQKMGA